MSIAKDTSYNLAGAAVSIVISLITVPLYLHQIGAARYGVLAITWLLLGYFGLFDLGLTRATANQIARIPDADAESREAVFWTAITLNGAVGAVGGFALYGAGQPLLGHLIRMSPDLRIEVIGALPFIAAAVPIATVTGVLTGALEARRRFGTVNIIQAAGTVVFQGAPLVAAYTISPRLEILIPVAVGARVISAGLFVPAVIGAIPLRHRPNFDRDRVMSLLSYGAWVTVTNAIGPILTSVDRFVIAAVSGATAVAQYTVPYNVAVRTLMVPSALSRALFPRLSAATSSDARKLTAAAITNINALMLPVIVLGILLMHPFLALWIGRAFANAAAPVGQIILLGVWINGVAFMPFATLQGQGRPDIVAKFHLLQLLPYCLLLWLGLKTFGLAGAAGAWTLRVASGATLLLWVSGALVRSVAVRLLAGLLTLLGASALVHFAPTSPEIRIPVYLAMIAATAVLSLCSSLWLRERFVNTMLAALRTVRCREKIS